MLRVRLSGDRLHLGSGLSISFQRTLRVPDTGEFPLPPGLGSFPVIRVRTPLEALPRQWRGASEFAIPVYQREAVWLGFGGMDSKPSALKIAAGGVNVVSGAVWREGLHDDPQDYIVVPDQPWLDGFNTGATHVRQFVAVRIGQGLSVEEELTGTGGVGGMQLVAYDPKPGSLAKRRPVSPPHTAATSEATMGLGAGGRIRQKVFRDPYGIRTWNRRPRVRLVVHLLTSKQFRQWTGREPPPSPISAETYAQAGLPWFDVYDEQAAIVGAPRALSQLKGIPADSGSSAVALDPRGLPVRRLRLGGPSEPTPPRMLAQPIGPARARRTRNGKRNGPKPTERKNDG